MDKKSLIKISVLILAVVGLTTAIFLLPKRITTRQRAAFSTAEISLTPASGSQTTGQQFDAELKIKTNGGAKVAVTDLYFLYDNTKLEVVSFDNSTSAYGVDNTTVTNTPQAGSIRITGAKMSNFPPATGDTFILGKFHLKGKVDGTATLQLDMTRSNLTGEGPLVTPPAQQDDNISFNSLSGSYTFTPAGGGSCTTIAHAYNNPSSPCTGTEPTQANTDSVIVSLCPSGNGPFTPKCQFVCEQNYQKSGNLCVPIAPCANPPVPTFASDAPADGVSYNVGATAVLKVNQITQKCGSNNAFYAFNAVFNKSDGTTATWGGDPLPNPSFSVGSFGTTGEVTWKVKSVWYDGATKKESAWTVERTFNVVTCSVPVPTIALSTASVVCNATPTPITITISPVTAANCASGLTVKYRVHHTSVPDSGQPVTADQSEGTIPLSSATVPEWSTELTRTNPGYRYTQSITGGTLFNTRVRKVYVEAALFSGTGITPVVRSGVSSGVAVQVGGTCPRPEATSTPIPTTPPANVPVLNFKVKFQEVKTQKADQKVSVRVNKRGTTAATTVDKMFTNVNVTADANGVYSGSVTLTDVLAGSGYTLFIKGPKHLAKKFCVNSPTKRCLASQLGGISLVVGNNDYNFSTMLLEAGDLPDPDDNLRQDGVANSTDWSLVKDLRTLNTPENLAIADVNLDGVINSDDVEMVRDTIETRYEDEE